MAIRPNSYMFQILQMFCLRARVCAYAPCWLDRCRLAKHARLACKIADTNPGLPTAGTGWRGPTSPVTQCQGFQINAAWKAPSSLHGNGAYASVTIQSVTSGEFASSAHTVENYQNLTFSPRSRSSYKLSPVTIKSFHPLIKTSQPYVKLLLGSVDETRVL